MASMLNIPSHNTDPNYRYRMPRLISKVEGRGNGIKTNIMNMADIARALKRPPEYPTKFCGTELGAQSKFDSAEGKSIVNGAHETRDLQVLIDKFVEKYVLCPNCLLPEIDIVVKRGLVACHCNACGHTGDLDNAHKVATFIVRNPPKGSDSTMGKKGKSKTDKKEKKGKGNKESGEDVDEGAVCPDGAKKKKEKSSKSGSKSKKTAAAGDDCDGDTKDSAAGSDENGGGNGRNAKKPSGKETNGGDPSANPDGSDKKNVKKSKSKSKKEPVAEALLAKDKLSYRSHEIIDVKQRLLSYYEKIRGNGQKGSADRPAASPLSNGTSTLPELFFSELRVLQVSQDFDCILRLFVTLDVLLNAEAIHNEVNNVVEDSKKVVMTAEMVEEIMPYLRKVIDRSMDTSKVCAAFEDFLSSRCCLPDSMTNFPFILHKLYLSELVEEDDLIVRYYQYEADEENMPQRVRAAQKSVKKSNSTLPVNKEAALAAQPFIKWFLENEDSSEDDEESDVSRQSPDSPVLPHVSSEPLRAAPTSSAASFESCVETSATVKRCDAPAEHSSDDEIDIDAI